MIGKIRVLRKYSVAAFVVSGKSHATLLSPRYEIEAARVGLDSNESFVPPAVGVGNPSEAHHGDVRAGLQAGQVTFGDLFTMQPFQDDVVDTFTLTGTQVWALLNQQLAAGTGGIMQVSGLHFTYTGTQGTGSITGVWLGAAGDNSTPIPNDASQTYTGTANSFMIGGGDGFTVLEGAGSIVQTADAELVPLVAYVGTLPNPFTYPTDGRIAIGATTKDCSKIMPRIVPSLVPIALSAANCLRFSLPHWNSAARRWKTSARAALRFGSLRSLFGAT